MSAVYVQRSGGVVVGVYATPQPGLAEEVMAANDADVTAFNAEITTPKVVSRFQALAALHQAGLLTTVETMMANPATPVLSRLAWENAQEFSISSPTLQSMAAALQLDDAALAALFALAAAIQA